MKIDFRLLDILILITPALVVIILNIVLLNKLTPQLNYYIQPSEIYMGYFNQAEISSIQNGTYTRDKYFNTRIVGRLSNIIFSDDKKFALEESCLEGCTYLHSYTVELTCTNETQLFYKDCEKAYSLTVDMKYIDSGQYPKYNCLVNTENDTCVSNCIQLRRDNYELILVQESNGKIEPAWTGLSNCNVKPNIKLNYDSTINPCILNSTNKLCGNSVLGFWLICFVVLKNLSQH